MVAGGEVKMDDSGVGQLLAAINNFDVSEKDANAEAEDEDKLLELNYACACRGEQIDLLFEVKPLPPIVNKFGVPQMTSGRTKRAPVRMMVVLDVSHSMSEPFGDNEGNISKLERVKIFASLLVRNIPEEHSLGIVTFGTAAKLIAPMRKMTEEYKEDALEAIQQIEIGGVTNLSAGIFMAMDQFVYKAIGIKIKGPAYDDNMVIFTDGMANEGITDTDQLVDKIENKIFELQRENHYPEGYTVRISTLGTGGFLPTMLYRIGQKFSSDAYYHLDASSNLELNIFRPIFLRSVTFAHRIKVQVMALNGVTMDLDSSLSDFHADIDTQCECADTTREMFFYIHDICEDSERHFTVSINLPKKHKKKLKGFDIMQVNLEFQDRAFRTRTIHKTIAYSDVPKKEKFNCETNLVTMAKHENRLVAVRALDKSCDNISRLFRNGAKEAVADGISHIQNAVDTLSNQLTSEEHYDDLTTYTQPILDNLEHAESMLDDLTIRYDDAWGRMKALSSSLARESPSSAGVYAPGAEMFDIRTMQKQMSGICGKLREYYKSRGLTTAVIDGYIDVINEMEEKWNKVDFREEEGPVVCFNININ